MTLETRVERYIIYEPSTERRNKNNEAQLGSPPNEPLGLGAVPNEPRFGSRVLQSGSRVYGVGSVDKNDEAQLGSPPNEPLFGSQVLRNGSTV